MVLFASVRLRERDQRSIVVGIVEVIETGGLLRTPSTTAVRELTVVVAPSSPGLPEPNSDAVQPLGEPLASGPSSLRSGHRRRAVAVGVPRRVRQVQKLNLFFRFRKRPRSISKAVAPRVQHEQCCGPVVSDARALREVAGSIPLRGIKPTFFPRHAGSAGPRVSNVVATPASTLTPRKRHLARTHMSVTQGTVPLRSKSSVDFSEKSYFRNHVPRTN